MRHVICHYHIYKNSGTTFDHLLERNFGDRHLRFDGPFPYFSIGQRELAKVIARNRSCVAFSSHQISLPIPASLDFNVLPVVFVRHPLLRIYSIYRYKRAENDGTLTSQHAMRMDFDEWCNASLGHSVEVVQVSNSQTRMLGGQAREVSLMRRHKEWMEYDLQQALRNLRVVELLARTEHFSADVSRFPAILSRYGIAFEATGTEPQNVTGSDLGKSVEQRLEQVMAELAPATREKMLAANRQDLSLYAAAGALLGDGAADGAPQTDIAPSAARINPRR